MSCCCFNDRVDRTETFQWQDAERRIRLMPLRQSLGKQGNREGTPGSGPHAVRLLPAIRFDRYICRPLKNGVTAGRNTIPCTLIDYRGWSIWIILSGCVFRRNPPPESDEIPPCGIRSVPTPCISTSIGIYPYLSCTFVAYLTNKWYEIVEKIDDYYMICLMQLAETILDDRARVVEVTVLASRFP